MKSILGEGYAWERKAGEPLPTLKSVAEKYQKNLKEQGEEPFAVGRKSDPSEYEPKPDPKLDPKFEGIDEAYDSHNMSALIELYHQYKDGGMSKEIFYQLLKLLTHDEREELMGYIKTRRDDEKYNLPDESPMDYSEDFMEEAYDAKGVEEAKDKKPAKKSDKKSKSKRWQDNDGDGKWYEKGDDVSEGDESALNMASLEESKFWGRVKGNLHGHEYILRETFKK